VKTNVKRNSGVPRGATGKKPFTGKKQVKGLKFTDKRRIERERPRP